MSAAGEWSEIGDAASVPEGEARSFIVGANRICLIRHHGDFYALADLCTHGHAFLSEGYCDGAEGVVECPLHGGLFDFRTGAAAGAPAERAAATYAVKLIGGGLLGRAAD